MNFKALRKLCDKVYQDNTVNNLIRVGATGWTKEQHPDVSHLGITDDQLLTVLSVIAPYLKDKDE